MKAATQFLKTLPLVKSDFQISFGKQTKILDYIFFEPILRFLHEICHCVVAAAHIHTTGLEDNTQSSMEMAWGALFR